MPTPRWIVEAEHAGATLFAPWQPASASDRTFVEVLHETGRAPRLTQAMSCVARELGRFFLDTMGPAPDELREFIVAACGSVAVEIGLVPLGGDAPARVPDATVIKTWRAQLKDAVAAHLPRDATEAGFWFGRRGDQGAVVVAFDRLRAEIQPFSLVPDANGSITVEGRLNDDVQYVAGYANQGRFGVDSCFVDPTVPRPRFRVTCGVAADDANAWIELVYAQPKRVLALPFVQFLARKDPAAPLAWADVPYAEPHPVASADEFAQAALSQLNAVRQQVALPPVRLSAAQTGTATGLAGHYFAAALGGEGLPEMDTIALGLLAGWQVGGMIRDANFVSRLVPFTRDAGRWLGATLAMPLGRYTLLDGHVEEVAIGPALMSSPDALGAVVAGYRFHHGNEHAMDVKRLTMRLVAARKRMHLDAPARLGGMAEVMRDELAHVNQGEAQPMQALRAVLQRGVDRFGANMRGYMIEATTLDALEIPKEVLEQPTLHMEIGVTHHRPRGAAWAQLVILVVYVDYPGTGV